MSTTSSSKFVVSHIVEELKEAIEDCSIEDTKLLARALSEVLEAGFVFSTSQRGFTYDKANDMSRAHQRSLNNS